MTLEAFHSNDVTVREASAHLWADVDRDALLRARLEPTDEHIAAARDLLEVVSSAVMLEAFVARPLAERGRHAEALAVRESALAITPRWDPWQSGLLLRGVADSLLAMGRPEEATTFAREALRHAPLDPWSIHTLAGAASAGDSGLALSLRAFLRDAGFGAPLVTGAPLPGEREVSAWVPNLADVAPISDEELARALVLRDVDGGFCARRSREVRHIQTLTRRGDLGSAACIAHSREGDSGLWTLVEGWLGLGITDDVTWTTLSVLRDALDGTREGAEARRQTRSKTPNRYSTLVAYNYDKRFRTLGSPDDLATLLFHPDRPTMLDATKLAPEHPLVARFVAARAEVVGEFPHGHELQLLIGTTGPWLHGEPVLYPMAGVEDAQLAKFPDRLVVIQDRRAKCAACKATLEPGVTALETGAMKHDGEPHWKRVHVACATTPSRRKELARAQERERRDLGRAER